MDIITVKHADDFTNPNGQATGGSITSELVARVIVIIFIKIENEKKITR
jgi:hypothetical protein